jgi:SAM-dependent methyltransferase
MMSDYRSSHAAIDAGANYNKTYDAGYYAALWIKIERPLIEDILRTIGAPQKTCLDFACGTGRITRVAAAHFGTVVGVDVSNAMLACADVPANVRLYRIDLTRQPLNETFDVVTAFRFFLNAEDALRRDALRAMRRQLNEGGYLICNVQMNATSPFGLALRAANAFPRSDFLNTLSIGDLTDLLIASGFDVKRVAAYGYLPRPGSLLPRLCEAWLEPVERIAGALRLPPSMAQQFLVVAQKR